MQSQRWFSDEAAEEVPGRALEMERGEGGFLDEFKIPVPPAQRPECLAPRHCRCSQPSARLA